MSKTEELQSLQKRVNGMSEETEKKKKKEWDKKQQLEHELERVKSDIDKNQYKSDNLEQEIANQKKILEEKESDLQK